MKFRVHYLPTYIPELDGPAPECYHRMFEQMKLLDRVGFDQVWVTKHHFHHRPPLNTAFLPSNSTIRLTHVLVAQAMVMRCATRGAPVQRIWLQRVQ